MKLEPSPPATESPTSNSAGRAGTLGDYVRSAVGHYFSQLNGHPTCGIYNMVMSEVEKPLIETVLQHTDSNQTKAAKALGISRSTLRKKMVQYGLE